MRYENPRQWFKSLKDSMAIRIVAAHHGGSTPTLREAFDPWAKDHKSLLSKLGFHLATRWARNYMQRLIKKVSGPTASERNPGQLYLDGMDVFRRVDQRFYFQLRGDSVRRSVNTYDSTHAQRISAIQLWRRGIQADTAKADAMAALDDNFLPDVNLHGDLPLIELAKRRPSVAVVGE